MIDFLAFPEGLRLLQQWQSGDQAAASDLHELLTDTINGRFDGVFSQPAGVDTVHVSASLNLMTLTIMHALFGLTSDTFYLGDPERYVRTTLMNRKLLGFNKMYLSWPVYALTAQAVGQETTYPDKHPPGSDPENMLVDKSNWRTISTPDLTSGIPAHIEKMLESYVRLTGFDPVLHLSAPYSLAADIFGQEPLIGALRDDPEFVGNFLEHLSRVVLLPWIDRFFQRFENGWVELSDASGSPFFIGPDNCRDFAIGPVQRLKQAHPRGHRIYCANYRGDYVTLAPVRRNGRKQPNTGQKMSLKTLSDLKQQVCQDFVIRLHDDRVDLPFYVDQAIEQSVPLFLGIGAIQIDRNSIPDLDIARREIKERTQAYVAAIKYVATTISANGYDNDQPPWPGVIYFEDVSAETSLELVEVIISTLLETGPFAPDCDAQK